MGIVERVAVRALIFRLEQDPSGLMVRTKRGLRGQRGGWETTGNNGYPVIPREYRLDQHERVNDSKNDPRDIMTATARDSVSAGVRSSAALVHSRLQRLAGRLG